MVVTQRLRLDRIASSTRNARLEREVIVGPDVVSADGYVLAVRILTDKPTYNVVEDVNGRFIRVRSGDVFAGTLGSRRALRGYAGVVPEALRVGDHIHVLNLGGVLGHCTSINPELGPPFDSEVLGAVLAFPPLGDRIGFPAHIRQNAIPLADDLQCDRPVVYVAGTSMDAGKTVAATEIVRGLWQAGLRVAGVKLTGVSLRRDALSMLDAGAVVGLTFNDAGIVSTRESDALRGARGLLNHIARSVAPDVIVAELGDGILGEYGVGSILSDAAIMKIGVALIVCAPDQVGAWGAQRLLVERFGLHPTAITGPATDNDVGTRFIRESLGVPAHNARRDARALVALVLDALRVREEACRDS